MGLAGQSVCVCVCVCVEGGEGNTILSENMSQGLGFIEVCTAAGSVGEIA